MNSSDLEGLLMNQKVSEQFFQARTDGSLVARSSVSSIKTVEAAYAAQLAQISQSGMAVAGWKLGATNEASLASLGFKEPFVGHVLEDFVHRSGDEVEITPAHAPHLETEIAIALAEDLPPEGRPYERKQIIAGIGSLHPSFEVVAFRMEGGPDGAGPLLIADSGANAEVVLGESVKDWSDVDLADHQVVVSLNGDQAAVGNTSVLYWADAVDAVVWLANHPAISRYGLKKGQIIMTGTFAGLIPISPGDEASADFGPLGKVFVRFR